MSLQEALSRIRQLDALVVNKIAAGEVVERPASVVKELLENSIDALATRVEVEVEQGGTELIRVVDDGEGIAADDLPLAVASHATSKIASADDLFRVQTLGFRGEALASIASVSRLRIRSRPADAAQGAEIEVDAGAMGEPRPCGCPPGTQIDIRRLFANTPVRRRFLKTTPTEFGHVSEQFARIALAHPRLHMVLKHNGKTIHELPASERLLDRLRLFYGGELAENLIWVESEADGLRLWGYVGHPSQHKSTRKGQYLFLNGRWIQDRALQHALSEAYRGLLMTGRHPVAFLFLEMPAEQVDVNVHPTKAEVRFRDSQPVYRQLLSTLRTKFLGMDLDSTMRVPGRGSASESEPPDPERQRAVQEELASWAKAQLQQWTPPEGGEGESGREGEGEQELASSPPRPLAPSPSLPLSPDEERETSATGAEPAPSETARAMQIHNRYLVAETDDGLTVIDQHALHERILYEHLRQRVLDGAVESQRMLVPQTIELSAREAALLLDHRELLAQFGYELDEFGQNTVALSSYPVMLARADHAQVIRDVLDQLENAPQKPSRRDLIDSLLHMMSCKAAVKAGEQLTPEEMESLLAQRHLIDDAHHCPHGRPTALVLTRDELDRQFGRMG